MHPTTTTDRERVMGPLQAEVMAPRGRPGRQIAAVAAVSLVGAALVLALAALGAAAREPAVVHVQPVSPAPVVVVFEALDAPAVAAPAEVEPPRAAPLAGEEFGFVVSLDGISYMVLGRHHEPVDPRAARLAGDLVDPEGAIAPVAPDSVGDDVSGWIGRSVIVEGGCEAQVSGLAVLGLMIGDTGYMAVSEEPTEAEVIAQILDVSAYLALELDGCEGTYARAGWLPGAVEAETLDEPALARAARARLLGSAAAARAQTVWDEMYGEGRFWRSSYGELDVRVVRHPVTMERSVIVHAVFDQGCGGAGINLLGIYRVADDGSLITEREDEGDALHAIDRVLDLDGDGRFELLGRGYIADRVLRDAGGDDLHTLEIPFFGCPC
jgi:hypothetical protein